LRDQRLVGTIPAVQDSDVPKLHTLLERIDDLADHAANFGLGIRSQDELLDGCAARFVDFLVAACNFLN
jgi:hypothetical protein